MQTLQQRDLFRVPQSKWVSSSQFSIFYTQGLTPLIGYIDSITQHAWLARNKSTAPNNIRKGVGQNDTWTNMENGSLYRIG